MITILTATTLIAILALAILSNNNVFAQMNLEDSPMMMEEDMEMMEGIDNGDMTMMSSSNQSESMMMNLNGTINVHNTIAEALKSKITTDIIRAIQAAQASVGANSFVKEAELTDAHGYLIYKIKAVDENMKKYKVIVDPGNGQVLMKKETLHSDQK